MTQSKWIRGKWISGQPSGPRERLKQVSVDALSDEELVCLVLATGTKTLSVFELSRGVLETAGGLRSLSRMSLAEMTHLQGASGLGPAKASRLVAAFELGRRALSVPLEQKRALHSSADVVEAYKSRLASNANESFWIIALDAKFRPLRELRLASGGLLSCAFTPADVFRELLRERAAAAIFIHNHPSGDPAPSPDDLRTTEELRKAGSLLGIEVVDHVIIGSSGHFSFRDAGIL